jgi:hypothetical protein
MNADQRGYKSVLISVDLRYRISVGDGEVASD